MFAVLLSELVLVQLDVINPEARRVEFPQHLHQVGQPRVLSQNTNSLQLLGKKCLSLSVCGQFENSREATLRR